jgi:hypothetical protein
MMNDFETYIRLHKRLERGNEIPVVRERQRDPTKLALTKTWKRDQWIMLETAGA